MNEIKNKLEKDLEIYKVIKVKFEDKNYEIYFKDILPKKTIVLDEKGNEYFGIARKLLRIKALEINYPGVDEEGTIYNKSKELITNSYFRKIYKMINNE
ncbi:hypothetical protein NON08_13335 [Cetobacterium somerae]|uniref:hypothetical protein n=1 Tax=Cetobacterium sp. NK01 TaxID=2993530 RepID=UPI00211625F8|nr:hypothetical protein [Cetobacterium sp. NK01]MCQ8213484.1 hypothetical protein [Cetobacterium sp. NK01]